MAENKLENSLKIAIGQSVNKCFEAVDITPENIMIEIPKDSTHGDYSTNIAMQLTRTLHKNPREIATAIVDSLDQEAAHVEKVEIADSRQKDGDDEQIWPPLGKHLLYA